MPPPLNEDVLEQASLEWLTAQGYALAHGPDLAPGMPASERADYAQVVLLGRLEAALARLNPGLPQPALVYTALNGLCSGSYRVIDATVWAKYFGRRHLGSIRGATMIGTVGGAALGAYPLGLSHDLTGSYSLALTVLLILPAAILLAAFWVQRPTRRGGGGVVQETTHA